MTDQTKSNVTVWGVYVGNHGDQLEIYNSKYGPFPPEKGTKGYIAIGWPATGDMNQFAENYADFAEKFKIVYPREGKTTASAYGTKINMPWHFAFTMKTGDWVVCPSSASGVVLIGEIIGDYENDYGDKTGLYGKRRCDFVHIREIRWLKSVDKSDPNYSKLNRIGLLTLCRPNIELSLLQQIVNS